jgi:hypothetical protein
VGLAGCDGLGGVGWAGGVGWVGWACAGCRGRCFGPRGVAANAPCGRGDGSPPGRAVRAGWLLRGLTVALNGGGVLPHTTSPQPPTPGRPDWPARIMITTPANTTIAAPAAATAYRGCRASAVRPPAAAGGPVAARPAHEPPVLAGSGHHRMPPKDVRMHPPCDQGWQRQCSNDQAGRAPSPPLPPRPPAQRPGDSQPGRFGRSTGIWLPEWPRPARRGLHAVPRRRLSWRTPQASAGRRSCCRSGSPRAAVCTSGCGCHA